jgi:hypothetical protein
MADHTPPKPATGPATHGHGGTPPTPAPAVAHQPLSVAHAGPPAGATAHAASLAASPDTAPADVHDVTPTGPVRMVTLPPLGTPGILRYRCRDCGAKYEMYSLTDGPGMLDAMRRAYNQLRPSPNDPANLVFSQWHACEPGVFGIADVVGMRTAGVGG